LVRIEYNCNNVYFEGLISNLPFEDGKERADAVSAFNRFIFQIIDVMNQAYSQKSSENRTKRQSHEKIAL